MARSARLVFPGMAHFVVQTAAAARRLFSIDGHYRAYLEMLGESCPRAGVRVLAWCLLPDRAKLVLVPAAAGGLAAAVGQANKRYTRLRNLGEPRGGRLFRGRFASCVLDQRHLAAALRHLETAPVRAGLAAAPEEWPWSSAGFHLGRRAGDPLVADGGLPGLDCDWAQLLAGGDEEAELALGLAVRTGRPAGGRRFTVRLERLTGRRLRRGRPGRPGRADAGEREGAKSSGNPGAG